MLMIRKRRFSAVLLPHFSLLLLACMLVSGVSAQTGIPDRPSIPVRSVLAEQPGLFPGAVLFDRSGGPAASAVFDPAAADPGDLVVGFPNPNEVREITDDFDVEGNVIVVGSGRLRVRDARLRVRGNVHVFDNGGVEIQGGTLAFEQEYLYQRAVRLLNKGTLWLNDAGVQCGGFNISCAVTDTAVLRIDGSSFSGGIMTTALARHGSVEARNSTQLGEMLFFDSTRGSFRDCVGLLSWLTLPRNSASDLTLPGEQVTGSYVFPDSTASAAGFDYRVSWEGCANLFWGLMLEPSCAAMVRDSRLLAVGGLFRGSGPQQVTGLVNNAIPRQFDYPAADRNVKFENCEVRIWNLYSVDDCQLTVANSIFGEILAMGSSDVFVQNSICDGSGGYVGCQDDATLLFFNSQVTAPVLARGRGQLTLFVSTLQTHIPHAADNGVLALFNSSYPGLPTVEAGAVAVVMGADEPKQAPVGRDVPVLGTMRFIAGDDVAVHFASHWFDAVRVDNQSEVLFRSPPSIVQRVRDTLGIWDTRGHVPGDHYLRLYMRLNPDDTISIPTPVQLTAPTSVRGRAGAQDFHITAVYPQPLRAGGMLTVRTEGLHGGDATLQLIDLLGRPVLTRRIDTATPLRLSAGDVPAGIYTLLLRGGSVQRTRTIHVIP